MSSQIHSSAVVSPQATIGNRVIVDPFAVVGPGVVLSDGVHVKSHAVIEGHTSIGEDSVIYPHAVIGTAPQDLKFRGERTKVLIGKRCQIREFVLINSSTQEGSMVSMGDDCMIMATCHIAHNCELGNGVIMANGAVLGGHVIVEDGAIIGGMTPIHQWSRIGRFAMVGGMSRLGQDVPPFLIGGGIPFKLGGLNLVGLKRRGMPKETRFELTKAFKLLYRSGLRTAEALDRIEHECVPLPEIQHFVAFCRNSIRGLVCMQGNASRASAMA